MSETANNCHSPPIVDGRSPNAVLRPLGSVALRELVQPESKLREPPSAHALRAPLDAGSHRREGGNCGRGHLFPISSWGTWSKEQNDRLANYL